MLFIVISIYATDSERDYNEVKVKLVTIGPGDDIFLRWGHFGIIVDYIEKPDLFFDYGRIPDKQAGFKKKFIKGVMTYYKDVALADPIIDYYVHTNRTIIIQELNLTPEQTEFIIKKLKSDINPENRYYQYDQYKNNCVSEINMILDEVTGGEFYKNTSDVIGRSFRELSRDYVSSNYINYYIIMFVLGSKVDCEITVKESLFLPDSSMRRVSEISIDNGSGRKVSLAKQTLIMNESIGRDPIIINSKQHFVISFVIGVLIALLSIVIKCWVTANSVFQIIIGTFLGIIGSILMYMSFFTSHYYIHNNWNLILVNPFAFFVTVTGVLKLINRGQNISLKFFKWYIDITFFLTVVMIILKATGFIYQQNGEIILLFLPVLFISSSLYKNVCEYIRKLLYKSGGNT